MNIREENRNAERKIKEILNNLASPAAGPDTVSEPRAREEGTLSATYLPKSTCPACSGLQELPQEAEVENLKLFIKVHADDTILTIDAQEDTRGFPVLTQDHLHLGRGMGSGSM